MWHLLTRTSRKSAAFCVALFFIALSASGQNKPSSTTATPKPSRASQESELERELNRPNTIPGRLGPSPSNKNTVPSNTAPPNNVLVRPPNVVVRPPNADSLLIQKVIATGDSIRLAEQRQIVKVTGLAPKGIRPVQVAIPPVSVNLVKPIPFIPVNIDSIRVASNASSQRELTKAVQVATLQPRGVRPLSVPLSTRLTRSIGAIQPVAINKDSILAATLNDIQHESVKAIRVSRIVPKKVRTPLPKPISLSPGLIRPVKVLPYTPVVRVAVADSAKTVVTQKPAVEKPAPIPVTPSVVQAKPLPVNPAKGGIPPATVPAQEVPYSPPTTPISPTKPTTAPATDKKIAAIPSKPVLVNPKAGKPGIVSPNIVRPQNGTATVATIDSVQMIR